MGVIHLTNQTKIHPMLTPLFHLFVCSGEMYVLLLDVNFIYFMEIYNYDPPIFCRRLTKLVQHIVRLRYKKFYILKDVINMRKSEIFVEHFQVTQDDMIRVLHFWNFFYSLISLVAIFILAGSTIIHSWKDFRKYR